MLERRLRDDGHAGVEQEPEHGEEQRIGPSRERVADRRLKSRSVGVDHAFLDLIATDRRTAHGGGQPVRQRRLARASLPGDDYQSRAQLQLPLGLGGRH